jgi:hypothetical protein
VTAACGSISPVEPCEGPSAGLERSDDVRYVITVWRGYAKSDAKIGKRLVRVVAAMHFPNWLRIDITCFCSNKYSFLEMGLKYAL